MIDAPELLPCPFCGGDAEFVRKGTPRYSTYVQCLDCACGLESNENFNHGNDWNTRADLHDAVTAERDGLAVENARLREALETIATHRQKCHAYDDDVGHDRRCFDNEDVKLMEFAARRALAPDAGDTDD